MSISLNVTFQKKMRGIPSLGSDHPALGSAVGRLDKHLGKAKLTELESFVSADPAEFEDVEGFEDSIPPEEWFPVADGLAAVRAAIGFLEANARALGTERADVLDELRSVETELAAAESKGAAFHFCLLD